MRKNIRTKKNRKFRKKNKSFKADVFKVGGAEDVSVNGVNSVTNGSDASGVDELKKKIQDAHSINNFLPDFSLGDSKVMKRIIELSEGLAIKTIDNTADFFNVNLNDSEQFRKRLEELKMILNDPQNKELMREVVANFAQVGVVALDAAKPFIDDLITEIFEKLRIVGNEFGEAGVKIALNTLEEIPGYGVIIGTIRSVSNAAEAVLASSNAFSEIVTKTSDTVNASVQNFDKLLKEKGDLIGRTTESINKFSENMKNMPNNVSNLSVPIPSVPKPTSAITGGSYSRKHKKNNNKSKKVRFNL
jgi:methyl-accepting chemotaxis protein